jgi:hypothetical protein
MSFSTDSFFQNLAEQFKKTLKDNYKNDHDETSS